MNWKNWPFWLKGGVIVSVTPFILGFSYLLIQGNFKDNFLGVLFYYYSYPGAGIMFLLWVFGPITETSLSTWQLWVISISLSSVIYFLIILFFSFLTKNINKIN